MSLSQISLGMHGINNSWNPGAGAHSGVTDTDLIRLASEAGSTVVRLPVNLANVGPNGVPAWVLDSFGEAFQAAAQYGIELIFEPGDVPADLAPNGDKSQEPNTLAGIEALAQRFGELVRAVHTEFPQYEYLVDSWEVGNEPNASYQFYGNNTYHGGEGDPDNPRFYVTSADQGTAYGQYLSLTANAIAQVEADLNIDINVVSAGILSNDRAYMDNMFATVRSYADDPDFDVEIDGFTVHPYTIYDINASTPESSRPTDWIPNPANSQADAWAYYHNFQAALYTTQGLANFWGFGDAEINVTEFGVPSWLGYRNAGSEGTIDQAYWMTEALGVFDSWDNQNLQNVVAHMILDNDYSQENAEYNAYDNDPGNNGSTSVAEGSFGLYERDAVTGVITPKPFVAVMQSIAGQYDYTSSDLRIVSSFTSSNINLSSYGTNGLGIIDGYVVLTHAGADSVTGSSYSDTLFAGDGDDVASGGGGSDRIYGGQGDDVLSGEAGDDDIYGNTGDDLVYSGIGNDRVDGGTGFDTIVLTGTSAQYQISSQTGYYFQATGAGGSVEAINVERVQFADGFVLDLADADVGRGNGGVSDSGGSGAGSGGGGGTSSINYISGTEGDDYITETTAGSDTVYALGGLDVIAGSAGNDIIFGAGGYNQMDYLGQGGSSSAFTFVQNDDGSITATSAQFGVDTLWDIGGIWFGEEEAWYDIDDLLQGSDDGGTGDGNGSIVGTSGVDYIDGTSSDDVIQMLEGDDVVYGSAGNDVIDGGAGYDQINYQGAGSTSANFTFLSNGDGSIVVTGTGIDTDTLTNIEGVWFGEEGAWYAIDDLVTGSSDGGPNYIYGTTEGDYLNGTAGDDVFIADEGDDVIYGSAGDDIMNGNGGYNQINYDGAYRSDFTFVDNADGSISATSAAYGTDLYWDIGGIWFGGEEAWYDTATLA